MFLLLNEAQQKQMVRGQHYQCGHLLKPLQTATFSRCRIINAVYQDCMLKYSQCVWSSWRLHDVNVVTRRCMCRLCVYMRISNFLWPHKRVFHKSYGIHLRMCVVSTAICVWEYIRPSCCIYVMLSEWAELENFQSFIFGNVHAFCNPTVNFLIALEPGGMDTEDWLFTSQIEFHKSMFLSFLRTGRSQHFSSFLGTKSHANFALSLMHKFWPFCFKYVLKKQY